MVETRSNSMTRGLVSAMYARTMPHARAPRPAFPAGFSVDIEVEEASVSALSPILTDAPHIRPGVIAPRDPSTTDPGDGLYATMGTPTGYYDRW
ncbi:hypothetical protein GCM10009855_21350 [Gordonia cholesterolivorans]|uniref:Uncharacterized protein n=1 Tax=Gordonia cholesterolivorans TaxID=559625 RepID=A0ABN3HI70_9ACTN